MKTYKVNEIFPSIQGEGEYVGLPVVFIRFSGCNLHCDFCDTDHSKYKEMTAKEIAEEVSSYYDIRSVVFTGGEPALQVDSELIRELIRVNCLDLYMETNGTIPLERAVSEYVWITVSPKSGSLWRGDVYPDNVKVIDEGQPLSVYKDFYGDSPTYFLQPMHRSNSTWEEFQNTMKATAQRVLVSPGWRLSLQVHKIIGMR